MSKMYGAQQRQMQAPSNPLAIKTKKFALEKISLLDYACASYSRINGNMPLSLWHLF